jgi:hypothetical protein
MLAERVARRFADLHREAKADPLWNQWLDEAHGGGKAKVPNPNPSTRGKYREVSFSTAMKDDAFKAHALKQFKAWKEQHKDDPKPEKKPKTPSKPRKKKPTRAEALDGGDAVFEHIGREKVHEKVKKLLDEVKDAKDNFLSKAEGRGTSPTFVEHVKKMSDVDAFLHFKAGSVGTYFTDEFLKGSEQWTHKDLVSGWTGSATEDDGRLMCAAVENLGYFGSSAPEDDSEAHEEAKHMAKHDERLQSWMQKVHTFQQEVFKALGVKEVTLYRGVKGGIHSSEGRTFGGPRVGDGVTIESRAISSFTSDPRIAAQFGVVVEYKVPVEHVFLSPLVSPRLSSDDDNGGPSGGGSNFGEAEFVIMGAEELEGTMTDLEHKYPKRRYAVHKGTITIPISKENEDWIRTVRKQRQMAKKIARAYARSSGVSRGR